MTSFYFYVPQGHGVAELLNEIADRAREQKLPAESNVTQCAGLSRGWVSSPQ